MTIFVTWQLRATLDSIRNSCDVFVNTLRFRYQSKRRFCRNIWAKNCYIGYLCFELHVYKVVYIIVISKATDIHSSKLNTKVHKGHWSHRAIQNTLKFTAYPNKCAQPEIYIYVMSIALMLASRQETSDSRALILNNPNITSTKGSSNISGCKHLFLKYCQEPEHRAQSQLKSKKNESDGN